MAEDQTNKSAVTRGKGEEQDVATTTTMTTTSYHHLLAERENRTLTESAWLCGLGLKAGVNGLIKMLIVNGCVLMDEFEKL